MKRECPKCKTTPVFWKLKDGRIKCKNCGSRIAINKGRIRIEKGILKKIVSEFVLEHSTNMILNRVDVSKYKLLKTLTLLRMKMTRDLPEVFEGTVEVDETYLGGQWKNKRLSLKKTVKQSKRGRGTTKQPVFGILCRNGKVWAELINNVEAVDLQPLIMKKVKKGSIVCSDTWRGYTGIAARGYVHRMVEHGKNEYSDKKGNHINGLEGFWGYLKRKLSAKGGVRRKIIHLYLGEYVWRYNHRNLNYKNQEKRLLSILFKQS